MKKRVVSFLLALALSLEMMPARLVQTRTTPLKLMRKKKPANPMHPQKSRRRAGILSSSIRLKLPIRCGIISSPTMINSSI